MKVRLDRSRQDCERKGDKRERRKKKIERERRRKREAAKRSSKSGVPIRTAKHSVNSRFVRLCLIGASEPLLLRKKIMRKS